MSNEWIDINKETPELNKPVMLWGWFGFDKDKSYGEGWMSWKGEGYEYGFDAKEKSVTGVTHWRETIQSPN